MKSLHYIFILCFVIVSHLMMAATRTASTSGNWNSTSTWGGSSVPTASDNVIINNNRNVTVNVAAVCSSLTISGGNQPSYITVSGTNTLTVGNAITIDAGTGSGDDKYITVGAGALTAASITMATTGNNNRDSYISISTGTVTVTGNITMNGPAARNQIVFTGAGMLNVGGTISGGTISNVDDDYTALTRGTVNYNGSNQTVGVYGYYNLILSNSGTKTTATGININGILSMEGTATASAAVTYGSAASLQYKGSAAQTTGLEFPTTFNGTGGVIINNSNGVTLGVAKTIGTGSKLTLISGKLNTTVANLLTVSNTSITAISGGTSTSFVNGPLRWNLPTISSAISYVFPVGDIDYLPFTLVNPTSSNTSYAQVQAFKQNAGGAIGASVTQISTTEYWQLSTGANFTNSSVSLSRNTVITPFNEIAGSTTKTGTYSSLNGTAGTKGVTSSAAIGTNRFFLFAKANSTITVTPTTLTGFTYAQGFGPSAQQSFNVSGANLTANIVVLPTDSFEISLTSGVSFAAQTIITLSVVNTSVGVTPIYVRMKAGLGLGTINPVIPIRCSSDGAVTKDVSCSGTVTNAPTITESPSALSGFYYNVNTGPSAVQSFTVSGAYLTSNLVITAPSNYEINTAATGTFVSTLTYTPSSGTVTSKTIYVRLKSGLTGGLYNQNISLTSTNITKTVACSGSVNSPYITVSTFLLGGFIYTSGAGPSGVQTVTVSGLYLTNNIVLTAPTNFEIKPTSSGTFGTTITLTQTSGTVSPTSIDVRMKSGLSIGTYPPINLTATSTGAIQQNVALSGKVVNTSTNITSSSALTGFVYTFGNGPSVKQSFTVSGSSLTNNITVTPPANFEICLTSNGTYVTTPLTIAHSGGLVNAQTVYVRLKAGLSIGTYTPVNIVISSSPAVNVNVSCNGKVIAEPTIVAGTSPASPVCDGTNLSLTSTGSAVTNQYWTGPNGYYYSNVTTPNPSLGTVTPANSGTYTVIASATSGVNLLTNGDFEDGNTGFGSSYLHTLTVPPEKGAYYIVKNPNTWWYDFCTCPPKSGNSQMVIDGATTNGKIAWAQSISVIPDSNYQFSYWMQSVYSPPYARMQLFVNGLPVGELNTAPNLGSPWKQFTTNVNAGSNSILQLTLINSNLEADGNDFAIDSLVFEQVFTATSSVDLVVNPIMPVSVSIVASADSITEGNTVTYTATPVNGGSTPAYQWMVNGNTIPGATNSTYSFIPNSGDEVECLLTSSLQCTSGNPALSNMIVMIVNPATNFWHGTNSSDWGTASNWTAGFVPLAGDDVIFSTVANNDSVAISDLVLDQNRTIGNLMNLTDKSIIIQAGKSLIVNQKVIGSVTNPDKLVLEASNDGVTPNGSLVVFSACGDTVMATVQLFAKGDNNHPYSWTDNIVGSPTFGQTFSGNYSWQFFGVPVQNVVAEPTFYGGFLREYNESINADSMYYKKWTPLGNSSVLSAFKGYEVTQDDPTVYTIKGRLMLCDQTISLTRSAPLVQGSNDPNGNEENDRYGLGQNVFGNSFTAAIPINQLTFPANVEEVVYLYNTGSFGEWANDSAALEITTAGSYRAIPKNTANAVYKQIPSMQGFLLRHIGTIGTTINMSLPYASLAKNDKPQTAPAAPLSFLEMTLKGGVTIDQLWLFSQEGTSGAYDNGWDGRKYFGRSAAYLYALTEGGNMQVSTTDNLVNSRIAFVPDGSEAYELTISKSNLEDYTPLFLADLLTGVAIELKEEVTSYHFTSTGQPGMSEQRFRIVASADPATWKENDTLNAYMDGANLHVINYGVNVGQLSLYDMGGRKVMEQQIQALSDRAIPVNLESGVYILQLHAGQNQFSTKCIIR